MDSGAAGVSVKASPWGNMQPCEPVRLADIMSEQLAKDLQAKEHGYVDLEQPEPPPPSPSPPPRLAVDSDCDSDHAIALMLQGQFDREYNDELKRTEDKFNGMSKVYVSYSKYRILPQNSQYDSESDEDEVDDKHREWDSFVSSEKAFKCMPKCGYKKEGNHMVTKHDIAMSGRRNACRVMEFPPEFNTGDGGGFDMQLSNKVFNSLKIHSRHEQSRRNRLHDKSEQATAELSLDPRTRLLLYKLVNQEVLDRVNGILSTGKEAVVIHADGGATTDCVVPKECAMKIFKTTLNEFKTRDKYIQDDFRFKDRFSKQNPRKIIHLWAEKEMHNLIRMRKANIRCPEVVLLKKHILVMSFIGENHRPAPKLKDVFLKVVDLTLAYEDVIETLKKLYTDAHIVHADMSEYNILWHNSNCWYIDVSQAVERNHPRALEFLLRDCTNISSFFTRRGLPDVMSPEDMFKHVSGLNAADSGPGALGQVKDFERDEDLLTLDQPEVVYPFEYFWEQSKN